MSNAHLANKYPCSYGTYSDMQVMQSPAGYYIGTTFEHTSGDYKGLVEPGSRESEYFGSREEAEAALRDMTFNQRPNP